MAKRAASNKKLGMVGTGSATNNLFCVKDIMRAYGLSYQTVNHYTDFGLLPVLIKRGNVRFYDKRTIDKRMKAIRQLMGEGYSLRLICRKLTTA